MRVAKEQAKFRERGEGYDRYVKWHTAALKKDAPIDHYGNKVQAPEIPRYGGSSSLYGGGNPNNVGGVGQGPYPGSAVGGVGGQSQPIAAANIGQVDPASLYGAASGNGVLSGNNVYSNYTAGVSGAGGGSSSGAAAQYPNIFSGIGSLPASYNLPDYSSNNPYFANNNYGESERQPTEVLCPSQAVLPPGVKKVY